VCSLSLAAISLTPFYNILLRTGTYYDFDDGRVIQYAKKNHIATSRDQEYHGRGE
jgi:hypothetical protein